MKKNYYMKISKDEYDAIYHAFRYYKAFTEHERLLSWQKKIIEDAEDALYTIKERTRVQFNG